MNPRRIHELMRKNFPDFLTPTLNWVNIADRDGNVKTEEITKYIDQYIKQTLYLLRLHEKLGIIFLRMKPPYLLQVTTYTTR